MLTPKGMKLHMGGGPNPVQPHFGPSPGTGEVKLDSMREAISGRRKGRVAKAKLLSQNLIQTPGVNQDQFSPVGTMRDVE